MKCRYCGKPVILRPSAEERAKKYGGSPRDYIKLFPAHTSCVLKARAEHDRILARAHRQRRIP